MPSVHHRGGVFRRLHGPAPGQVVAHAADSLKVVIIWRAAPSCFWHWDKTVPRCPGCVPEASSWRREPLVTWVGRSTTRAADALVEWLRVAHLRLVVDEGESDAVRRRAISFIELVIQRPGGL